MVQAVPASKISLADLEQKFGLSLTEDPDFFRERQAPAVTLAADEIQRLDQAKRHFQYLLRQPPMLEGNELIAVLKVLKELSSWAAR